MEIVDIPLSEYESIAGLWMLNGLEHNRKSTYFCKDDYKIDIEQRIKTLGKKEALKISICNDDGVVGYCISSIEDTIGEIESLYVLENSRNKGIGRMLLNRHLEWLNDKCDRIKISTVFGNNEVIAFYSRFSFFPKSVVFERNKNIPRLT